MSINKIVILYILLNLVFLPQHYVCKIYPYCYVQLWFMYIHCWIICHCIPVSQLIYRGPCAWNYATAKYLLLQHSLMNILSMSSWPHVPRKELARSSHICIFNFIKCGQFFSQMAVPIYSPSSSE